MGKTFKTRGVVLKRINLGEADKLVTLLSPTHGKLSALAPGIRKLKSRKAPHLELLNDVTLFITRGKLHYITEAETNQAFSHLRGNLSRIAYAYKIVELIDKLMVEGEIHPPIFHFLVTFLIKLNDSAIHNFEQVSEECILHFLWELGYLPKENSISGSALSRFLEIVLERRLKSDNLLGRLVD